MATSVRYHVERLTVEIDAAPAEFRARYEQAVPPLPEERMADLVRRHAPWAEMLAVVEEAAPFGFLIYNKIDADPLLRLAGDEAFCTSYLMGNHTIAERMFRYEPAVLLYAPLHTVIWGDLDGPGALHLRQAQRPVRQLRQPGRHRGGDRARREGGRAAPPPGRGSPRRPARLLDTSGGTARGDHHHRPPVALA